MADVKISQLTALASASSDVAADVLAIVDTSVPQTKKITIENLVSPITLDKSNSRVGIGTASPTSALQIDGDYITISQTAQNGLRLKTDDTAVIWVYDKTSDAITGGINWGHSDGATLFYTGGINERMRIDSSGKVGIGETSPLGNLHVKSGDSGVSSPDITELVVEGSGNTGISILTPNNQQGEIAFGDPQDANVGRIAYNHDSNFLATVVNGSEVMRITSAGKVGIGQTTVNAMLDIDDGGANTGIGVPQIRVGSINNTGVYGLIGFGWGGNTTYSPVTIGGLGTSGSGSVEADFVINTRDGTSDAVPVERLRVTHDGFVGINRSSNIHERLTVSGMICSLGSSSTSSTAGNQRAIIDLTSNSARIGHFRGSNGAGSGATQFFVDSVYVGKFDFNGDFYSNDGTVHNLSDKRGKKDIQDLSDGLDIVKKLKPVTYKWNGKAEMSQDDDVTRYGFVADDILEVASQYVAIRKAKFDGKDVDDYKTISMLKMFPMLVKAVQELSAKVEALEGK